MEWTKTWFLNTSQNYKKSKKEVIACFAQMKLKTVGILLLQETIEKYHSRITKNE